MAIIFSIYCFQKPKAKNPKKNLIFCYKYLSNNQFSVQCWYIFLLVIFLCTLRLRLRLHLYINLYLYCQSYNYGQFNSKKKKKIRKAARQENRLRGRQESRLYFLLKHGISIHFVSDENHGKRKERKSKENQTKPNIQTHVLTPIQTETL